MAPCKLYIMLNRDTVNMPHSFGYETEHNSSKRTAEMNISLVRSVLFFLLKQTQYFESSSKTDIDL